MPAGMRRVEEVAADVVARDPEILDVIVPVYIGDGSGGMSNIDVGDPAYSPVGVPVALKRGQDGVLRADADAMALRPTRDETTAALTTHVNDPTPHPQYDDLPDLTLIFENRLV